MSLYPFSFLETQMSTAKHTKAWRDRKKQAGLCPHCGRHPSVDSKRCPDCQTKVAENNSGRFQKRYDNGLCGECGKNPHRDGKKSCISCSQKRRNKYASCGDKDTRREQAKVIRQKRRQRILAHYGNKCVCCGEDEPCFLAIDHIDGGGNEHRRQIGNNPSHRCGSSSTQFVKWIEKNNFPNTLQLLCHNCNMGKHLNCGICPHKARISQGTTVVCDQ